MDIKNELISLLKIAETNFLMSIKELNPDLVNRKIVENVNAIAWIVGHCVLNFDRCLSMFTNEQQLTKDESEYYIYGSSKDGIKDSSLPFVKLIDIHLELTTKLYEILEKHDVTKYEEIPHEQAKGKLSDIIKSIALHVMGHVGQIVLIRRMAEEPFWSFVRGVEKEDQKELRKTWITWWKENKTQYH